MLVVFGALKIELGPILRSIHIYNIHKAGKTIIYEGFKDSGPIAIIQTGMGAKNAMQAAKFFKDNFLGYIKDRIIGPENNIEVLMIGFCGATDESMKIGDTVVYSSIKNITRSDEKEFSLNSSLELGKDGPARNRIKDGPLYAAGATVPEVITSPAAKKQLNTGFDIQAIDMESYPVAETVREMNLPFSCIRVVSDGAGDLLPSYFGSTTGIKMAVNIMLSLLRSIFDRKELTANKNAVKNIRKANLRLAKVSADLISGFTANTSNKTL
ncbi:MAG: hypothetical protein K8S14_08340 [Actinomycetia bacterium]|nr:hypothetical protein [Actinomycetes bacterium]